MYVDVTTTEILCSDSVTQYSIKTDLIKTNDGECFRVNASDVKDKFSETSLTEEQKIDVFVEAVSALLKNGKKIQII